VKLTENAQAALAALLDHPIPRLQFAAPVAVGLLVENLAESVLLPSPFKAHHGTNLEHLQITQAGRDALAAMKGPTP
jgi:hypothetical protein